MRRNIRSRQKPTLFRERRVLFLTGGIFAILLLFGLFISLDPRTPVQGSDPGSVEKKPPGKAMIRPTRSDSAEAPPAPSVTGDFTFYDTLPRSEPSHPEFTPPKSDSPTAFPIPPKKSPALGGTPASPELRYTVQVAALRDRSAAEGLVTRLKKKGYKSYINSMTSPNRGTWFRVRVGHSISRKAAQQLAQRLSGSERLTPFITLEK